MLASVSVKTDYGPEELQDNLLEKKNSAQLGFSKVLPVKECKEKLKLRKVPRILQYHVPNKPASPEEYFHRQLFMNYPFRNEAKLKAINPPIYSEKYMNP